MHTLKLPALILAAAHLSLSNPMSIPVLFRRQCSGGALTVLEGSTCDMGQANTLACSDNCFDIVTIKLPNAAYLLTVHSFNAVNSLLIQILG